MLSRWIFWILGLILLVVGVGGAAWFVANGWELPGTVAAVQESPSFADDVDGVVCFGYVDLEHGLRMLAPVRSGRVRELHVRENQEVLANAPLLSLEDRDAKLQLEEAQKAVEAAHVRADVAAKIPVHHEAKLAQQEAAVKSVESKLAS